MDLLIVTLLIVGLALMALEAIVPKIGILAVSGTVCFAGALFTLRQQGTLYNMPVGDWALLSLALVGVIVLGAAIFFIWRTALKNVPDPLIGRQARVTEWQDNTGRIHIDGDSWTAKSDTAFAVNDVVEIVKFDPLAPLTVHVKPIQG